MGQKIFIRRSEDEVLCQLRQSPELYHRYLSMTESWQNWFREFCQGKRTLPLLYDSFFKKVFHPENHSSRLENCLSCILGQNLKIKQVLPSEDILMDGQTLLVMDIVVELEDGAYVLVEIQKIPYDFPAERASCYSSDLLLRQYTRMKQRYGREFSYHCLKKVYTVVIYEKSTDAFHKCPQTIVHHVKSECESGLKLNFLQEFYLIALDVFKKSSYSKIKDGDDRLCGWLSLLSTESTEEAEQLCETYPWLEEIYREMASYSQNQEEVLYMFSAALREMDRNAVQYMVEKQEKKLKEQEQQIVENEKRLAESEKQLAESEKQLAESEKQLAESEKQLAESEEQRRLQEQEIERLKQLLVER